MSILIGKKQCSKCRAWKDKSEFYPRPGSRDGLRNECKECRKSYRLNRYYNNREAEQQYFKEWARENADYKREYDRRYFKEHKEEHRVYKRARYAILKILGFDWRKFYRDKYARNPEAFREKAKIRNHKRRALQKGNGGELTKQDWLDVLEIYGNKCLRCGSENITIDHVTPISCGGKNEKNNVQPLCKSCNSWKKDRTIDYRGGR